MGKYDYNLAMREFKRRARQRIATVPTLQYRWYTPEEFVWGVVVAVVLLAMGGYIG